MPLIIDKFSKLYRLVSHNRDADFQSCVTVVANQMFGATAVYVGVRQGLTANDIVTIPSGYVVDTTEAGAPKLFVVKAVIAKHAPFWNTGVELFKLVAGFDESQSAIRDFLRDQIAHDNEALARLEEARKTAHGNNVNEYLDAAVRGDFHGLVVIDDARAELNQVLSKINADISVLELKTFEADDGSRLYQIDTLYGEEEAVVLTAHASKGEEGRGARRARLANVDTIIVPTRTELFKRLFLAESQWRPIRIAPALRKRIRFIAAYQAAPVNAVTHIAEIRHIISDQQPGYYTLTFKGNAREIRPVPLADPERMPSAPVYVRRDALLKAETLEAALS